ncbi:MAG TPA: GNAT family protein [Nitrolancea sp.]|jgi:RimJ/RimL family protein N-acetyltransferase|nr:GNAT family protein [Nitrolancea sp.]
MQPGRGRKNPKMALTFTLVGPSERDDLIRFITADTYPYNATPEPSPEQVAEWIDTGLFTKTFWIVRACVAHVGVLQYQDSSPVHAEIHIRLHAPYRGQGIGTQAILWLTENLFRSYPQKHRLEGWVRSDNDAMRRVSRKCGYTKEAHLRRDFSRGDGTFADKVGYGILREEWEHGTRVAVHWDDE